MKKFRLFIISAFIMFGLIAQVKAEQSPQTATGSRYQDNQVFTVAYNNSGATIQSNSIVILDTTATENTTLGAYITTTTTADSPYVFGVTDETIASGETGRVCIRGPHRVLDTDATHAAGALLATSTTAGQTTTYSTADGTAGGVLGQVIGATSDLGANYAWVWVDPQVHK